MFGAEEDESLAIATEHLMVAASDTTPNLMPAGPAPAHDLNGSALLEAIVKQLPFGLTVQDEKGEWLLINDMAAKRLDTEARGLDGAPPASSAPLSAEQNAGLEIIRSGKLAVTEQRVARPQGERVLLNARQPLQISGRNLLVSASIDVTEQKSVENDLFQRAYYDELTGLPKRALIENHIQDLVRQGSRFALATLDIDDFKHINDYYGPAAGDALLIKLAKRLSAELGEFDVLARFGGDEFLLVLDPVADECALAKRIDALLKNLRAPLLIDDYEILASASIGVGIFPDHGDSYDTLRQNADLALSQAKSRARGDFAVFNATMEQEAAHRAETEQRLRLAILEKRFRCAFQPKVDIRTRQVHGVEALVRLSDENGIIQGPGTFIELAIELGLIDEMTHQVLAEIVQSLDLIDDKFGPDVTISLNVAAKQACDRTFMESLAGKLAATGCPSRFMIEVTEDAFVRKQHFQSEILPLLRQIGARVSIDDFGTGYSSLSALADITADEVKIDRSFITDIHKRPRNQSILRAIESLSKSLGMTVIAEGVETFEELAYLQAASEIRYAQGFYFSKPVFMEELAPNYHIDHTTRNGVGARQHREDRVSQLRARH